GQNDGASRTNLLHLTGHAGDLDAIADGDRSFGQNNQAADEIARDVLQSKSDADTDGAGENGQRAEMNAGVFQDNENSDHEHDVARDLGDGVLQRAIESAVGQEPVKEKTLGAGGDPENCDQQRDEEKDLKKAQCHAWQRLVPGQWNPG